MNSFSQIKDRSIYNQSDYENENIIPIQAENGQQSPEETLQDYMDEDIELLLRYALDTGKSIPDEVGQLLSEAGFENSFLAHKLICESLAPATPETVKYILKYQKKKTIFFSNIPLVRNFIFVAIVAIAGLITSGLFPEVNHDTLSRGILNNNGIPLLINLIFLCSAAGIGAIFFILSQITKEVKNATLSTDDGTYYWTMLIMGMLSGLIMSEMIVLNQELDNQSVEMNRLLFALLGGFSSEIVFSIMQKIMEKVRDIIAGS